MPSIQLPNSTTVTTHPFLFGQLISFLVGFSAITTTYLTSFCGVNLPAFQSLGIYAFLCCIHCKVFFKQSQSKRDGNAVENATGLYISLDEQITDSFKIGEDSDTESTESDEENNNSNDTKATPLSLQTTQQTNSKAPLPPKYTIPFTNLPLHTSIKMYPILSILDVSANYIIIKSFSYTSITSISLIDCTTIPFVMVFSFILLGRRYEFTHGLGSAICIVGLTLTIYFDQSNESSQISSNPVFGDLLALTASLFYAMNNVLCEYYVRNKSRVEYLFMLGFFGTIFSSMQVVAGGEIDGVKSMFSNAFKGYEDDNMSNVDVEECPHYLPPLLTLSYVLTLTAFYVLITHFLTKSNAALLNISLLTSDLYACLFSILVEDVVPSLGYFGSVVVIFFGVFVYERGGEPIEVVGGGCSLGSRDEDGVGDEEEVEGGRFGLEVRGVDERS